MPARTDTKSSEQLLADNRKASHEYFFLEMFEAGVALLGTEVKAIREGRVNLRDSYARINNGEGSLGKLLNDDAFSTSLSSTTKNLDGITGRLNRGEGTAGKILTDDALYKRIDALTARLEELTTKLSSGDGTAAHLINDRQLYDNLNKAVTELNGLLSDVRKDPQKYLRVKVSIF